VFSRGRNKAATALLTAWVYVTPAGAVDAMVMNGQPQK
jgi:hypothetical protein